MTATLEQLNNLALNIKVATDTLNAAISAGYLENIQTTILVDYDMAAPVGTNVLKARGITVVTFVPLPN